MSRWSASRWNFRSCTDAGGGGGGPSPLSVNLVKLSPDPVEVGADLVNPQFNASKSGGGSLTVFTLADDDGNPVQDILAGSDPRTMPFTYNKSVIGAQVVFTLVGEDGSSVAQDQETHTWLPRVYLGIEPIPGAINEAFVEALAENELRADKGISRTGLTWAAGEYIWVAFPSSFGPASPTDFLISVGGSGFPGGMVQVAAGLNVTPNTPSGVPIPYDVWRSTGAGVGVGGVSVDVTP